MRIFWNGKTAMNANQEKLDVISNNLANVNTTGYKKLDVKFTDLMSETYNKLGYPTNSEKAFTGTGVKTTEALRAFTQGSLTETSLKTDVAIDGSGFFRMERPDGSIAYTRNGSFNLDGYGRLTDGRGNLLFLSFKEGYGYDNVQFTSDNLTVNKNGEVAIKRGEEYHIVAAIPLYSPVGDNALYSVGESLYQMHEGSQMVMGGAGDILQGYIENSNVDMGEELTDMIITQRAYQFGAKIVETADEMWAMINNLRR